MKIKMPVCVMNFSVTPVYVCMTPSESDWKFSFSLSHKNQQMLHKNWLNKRVCHAQYRISSKWSRVSNTSRVSNRCQGWTANTIGLMELVHRTVVLCVIRDVLQYILVFNYGIRCSIRRKTYTLKLKLEAGEPGGFNRSRVSNTSWVSNRSLGSDGIVLIEAGGFYWRKYGIQFIKS